MRLGYKIIGVEKKVNIETNRINYFISFMPIINYKSVEHATFKVETDMVHYKIYSEIIGRIVDFSLDDFLKKQ